ncbi:MAG: ABC transporter ATP-binding protein [Candidatus Diapherotrites archaeon]|nr:ABC transporter ATP-binding protein [Candidatus Diapherotrites archaeon]
MPKKKVIEMKNVCKEYTMGKVKVKALCGVTLDVYEGDFIVIIGPSGSGKSTMLHLMGALDKPSSGKVFINGKDLQTLDDWGLAMLRRKFIGFVFQSFHLIPTLNALENVMLPLEPTKIDDIEKIKRAKELLKIVGVEHRMFHKPTELSGGESQRVAIARALINDPKIVLADEPTGNLDSKTTMQIMDTLQKMNKEKNKTFIIVTHDLSLTKYGNRILYIKDGLIDKMEER